MWSSESRASGTFRGRLDCGQIWQPEHFGLSIASAVLKPHHHPLAARMNSLSLLRASLAPARRSFASTSFARADAVPSTSAPTPDADAAAPPPAESAEAAAPVEDEPQLDPEPTGRTGNGYRAWLNGEGAKFRNALHGRTNWIGDTVSDLGCLGTLVPAGSRVAGTARGDGWRRRGAISGRASGTRPLPERGTAGPPAVQEHWETS